MTRWFCANAEPWDRPPSVVAHPAAAPEMPGGSSRTRVGDLDERTTCLRPRQFLDTPLESVDRARRLARVTVGEALATVEATAANEALDEAVLAASAQLLGAGRRLLDDTVAYAGARRQFGRAIGTYQAVKHALPDVKVGLDFAAHGLALGPRLARRRRALDP
jgi:alkylation response protein AidB-like acyl-CoA dehydrogenase